MKKIIFIILIVITSVAIAGSGIKQTYVVLNSGADQWLAGGVNEHGAPSFHNKNFGTFEGNQSLILKGAEVITYKNNNSDVFGANLYYRIYKQGFPADSFIQLVLPHNQNYNNGVQKWQNLDLNLNLLTLADSDGTWVIEVYWKIPSSDGDHFDSNFGNNFKAYFTVQNALPVELISFNADIIGDYVNLNWRTATEVNNYGFEIEKRHTNIIDANWEKIAFVKGHGNSNSTKSYSYIDKSASFGGCQYRLKQIDTDGKFEYHEAISVNLKEVEGIHLEQNYPNPFNPITTINFAFEKEEFAQLKIYNSIGKEITTLFEGNILPNKKYNISFNASNLSSGVYYYSLSSSNGNLIRKMLLLK